MLGPWSTFWIGKERQASTKRRVDVFMLFFGIFESFCSAACAALRLVLSRLLLKTKERISMPSGRMGGESLVHAVLAIPFID
jgi:hypothetical protein